MSSMQQDDTYDHSSDVSPGADRGGAAGQFQPSAKLREKMEKLAKWRLDSSLIEFPQEVSELHGGHATVSHAFLNLPSNKSDNEGGLRGQGHAGHKDVAVKKLKIPADKDLERLLGLTLREARFLVELSHPSIVRLEGFVENVSEGIIWLLFPWEANGNLRDFIASGDWEIPERISLINDVALGLEYLHNRNPPICHGDLKSVNILVNSECRALITDFGSARRLTDTDARTEPAQVGDERQPASRVEATFCASTNTVTLTGSEFTLRWAAPELLNDEPPTVKVDIWALGWISYEVMTNSIPFEDVIKDSIVIKRVTQGHLPSITGDTRMSMMLRLCRLMSECWTIDSSQRPTATYSRKSLSWLPRIAPDPNRTRFGAVSEARSPQLLVQLGTMHRYQADYANASKFYIDALQIFTDTADRKGRARTLNLLADMRRTQGNAEEAIALYSEALQIYASMGDRKRKAVILNGLGTAYLRQGDFSRATAFYSNALDIYIDINEPQGKAVALDGLAYLHRRRKEYKQAATLYTEALRLLTNLGEQHGRASAMWGLAEVHRLQNEHNQAITFYSDALKIYTEIGDARGRAFALDGLAQVKSNQGRHIDAIELYEQAAKLYDQIGDARAVTIILEAVANARRRVELS